MCVLFPGRPAGVVSAQESPGEAGSEEERGFPGCRALGLGRQRSCVGMLDWVGGVSLSVVLLFVLSWLRAFVCVSV